MITAGIIIITSIQMTDLTAQVWGGSIMLFRFSQHSANGTQKLLGNFHPLEYTDVIQQWENMSVAEDS